MKLNKTFLLIVLSSLIVTVLPCLQVFAADTYSGFYGGQLAKKYDISVSLKEEAGELKGYYYYVKHGGDIPLTGTITQQGKFKLTEKGEKNKITGSWEGTIKKDILTGFWQAPGKKRKLRLKLYRNPKKYGVFMPIQPGESEHKEMRNGGVGLVRYSIQKTGFEFVKLTRHQNPKVLNKINRELKSIEEELLESCYKDGEVNFSYRVRFFKYPILSIYAGSSYFCPRTAHPTLNYDQSRTFDLKTGKTVEFPDLFDDFDNNKQKILSFLFEEPLKERELERQKLGNQEDDGNCAFYFTLKTLLETSGYSYIFTEKGLQVEPEFPHFATACVESATVPYVKLKKIVNPNSLLGLLSAK